MDTSLSYGQVISEIDFNQNDTSGGGRGKGTAIKAISVNRTDTGDFFGNAQRLGFFVSGGSTGQVTGDAEYELLSLYPNGRVGINVIGSDLVTNDIWRARTVPQTLTVNGTIGFYNSSAQIGFYQGADTYVGIGTTSPAYLLELANNAKALNVSGMLYVSDTNVSINGKNTGKGLLQINQADDTNSSGMTLLNAGANQSFRFWVDALKNGRIDVGLSANGNLSINGEGTSGGYVGIGTTTPSQKLHVNGSIQTESVAWKKEFETGAGIETVWALKEYNGKLYASLGQSATGDGDVYVYDGNQWTQSLNSNATTLLDGSVITANSTHSLAVYKGKLYAGVQNDTNHAEVYVFNTTDWILSNDSLGISNNVISMEVYNGKLYAGTGGATAGMGDVYAFDGTSWTQAIDMGASIETAYSMKAYNGKLYIGTGVSSVVVSVGGLISGV